MCRYALVEDVSSNLYGNAVVEPRAIERVVIDIDNTADQVRGTNWQTSQPSDRAVRIEIRKALNKYGLPAAGQLFNRAYAYIEANY